MMHNSSRVPQIPASKMTIKLNKHLGKRVPTETERYIGLMAVLLLY